MFILNVPRLSRQGFYPQRWISDPELRRARRFRLRLSADVALGSGLVTSPSLRAWAPTLAAVNALPNVLAISTAITA